jgi:hypothetical protein
VNERRQNWKQDLSKEARARGEKRVELLAQLEETREEIQKCGLDFARHDELKLAQRTIVAQLATL